MRTLRRGAALVAVLLLVLAAGPGLAAADPRAGGTVVVRPGETVGDLETFAGTVIVRGTVDGDLTGAAGTVVVTGTVTGNVDVAAGTVDIGPGAVVGGDVDVAVGTLNVDGVVEGDVRAAAGEIVLGPDARIAGDLRYGEDTRIVGDVGVVDGSVVRESGLAAGPVVLPGVAGLDLAFSVYGLLVGLLAGAVLLYAAPRFSGRVTDRALDDTLRSGGVGLLAVLAAPVVVVLLAVTIVGIPFAVLAAVLFAVAAWVGSLYGRIAVGTWLADRFEVDSRVAVLLAGFLSVFALSLVPYVGWVVEVLVALVGIGALVAALYDARRSREPTPESEVARPS